MFGGSSAPAEQQADNSVASQASDSSSQSNAWGPRSCETDAKTFTKCLDDNQGNMQICGWYLDQLVIATSEIISILGLTLTCCTEGLPASSQSVLKKAEKIIARYDTEEGAAAFSEDSQTTSNCKLYAGRFFQRLPGEEFSY